MDFEKCDPKILITSSFLGMKNLINLSQRIIESILQIDFH